ncbi:MAG: GDP-mannose 4,6-dehydratase [Nanoarchaeota archaeon]|nr:GDP-mannose 4,6-dehydratase [Nanoarchaeota archaeon]
MPKALITGITGQDGSYMAEFLLSKGYEVYGLYRRSSGDYQFNNIQHIIGRMKLVCADLTDAFSLDKAIASIKPDEIYNLAAQSQVRVSFDQPYLTKEINWIGVERLLDSIKNHVPKAKLYQASTSEMFGAVLMSPQNEETPFNPVSPYAYAKVKAHEAVKRERQKGLFACGGILFNHESPRRGLEFVTRKFTDGIARIKLGLPQRETGKKYLELGNLNARRDWGYAGDYVEAMWLMLQHSTPEDYVIATGENHSVREFVEFAALAAGIKVNWKGEGVDEKGYDQEGNLIVCINPAHFRPAEVNELLGDSSKAKKVLGWKPTTSFEDLVKLMVESDIKKLSSALS